MKVDFAGQHFEARPAGTLWWPERRWLIVADLHLGKSARMAARGGSLLPPHEDQDTLLRLKAEMEALPVARLVSLGDAFDDALAPEAMRAPDRALLEDLAGRCDWTWVTGNHDHAAVPGLGEIISEIPEISLTLRHIAGEGPDISGHYHPKSRLGGTTRPAFLIGRTHLVLPAFGTYTGGLDCDGPVLSALVGPGLALLTGRNLIARPLGLPTKRKRA
ncbi:ligase-associated DNA damage response endonuclease PdeM [Cereibacter sphaeroides]|nr:ligase-associated DNA damage response endonuclease PdeM [Cereibacter sphaeroides]